jgi:hypothetical protein
MLHTESPVIFNKRNERINYRVKKNLVIIDELIEKITIRRGKEKITITKKKYKMPIVAVWQENAAAPSLNSAKSNVEFILGASPLRGDRTIRFNSSAPYRRACGISTSTPCAF